MLTGPNIIIILKVLVSAVTVLFVLSLIALARGKRRLHGRINTAFFVLTMMTVIVFESLLRLGVDVTSGFSPAARQALRIHLIFAIPSAILLPILFFTGFTGRRRGHVPLGVIFAVLWVGTFLTGVFFLPNE
ncbi:MAG: DUF420 domain-containing protein [Bacteroidales bacterium]|nr:DUF420 domain-containing protein [Bacteroidales bacterium]